MKKLTFATLFIAGVMRSGLASAQEVPILIEAKEKWTNLPAETKVKFHFTIKVPQGFKGRVIWTFADVATKRILAQGRGEVPITADGDKLPEVKIPLLTPPLNGDVVLQSQLKITVITEGQEKPGASFEKTLWIFPADPFFNRTQWLKELKIFLLDPGSKSSTAKFLQVLKVPFEEIPNANALTDVKEGLVLVGEGVSFKEEAGLGEALVQVASRGLPVICLAPASGTIALPGADSDLPAPENLTFRRQNIIAKFDKRLDAQAWAPDNQVVTSSLALKAEEGKVVVEALPGAKGWPWVQLDFPAGKGRLIFCGFPIVAKWETSPTPRFLFARMLEHATERSDKDKSK